MNKIEGNVLGRINSDSLWAVFDLATLTDFFGSKYKSKSGASALSSMSKDPDVTFIGGLLIKLALINRYNAEKVFTSHYKSTNNIRLIYIVHAQ